MAWCPKCKSEYVDGITTCVDCGCDLVESLGELNEAQENLQEYTNENAEIPELDVLKEAAEFAFDEEPEKPQYHHAYVNNEEKAEDNKSSAFTLLLVGTVGMIFILLFFFDVISIQMTMVGKYMISGVMGVLFLLFIIMGLVSLRNSKVLKQKACKENNLTQEIKKWCESCLSGETIDITLEIQDLSEELKYFQRTTYMREMILNQFMNLDDAYLDRLIEEIYPVLFEENES